MTPTLRDEIFQLHAKLCTGLADPNRILILYKLDKASSNVSDLADELGISQPSVSRHLKVLRESGLVRGKRDGHSVIYSLSDERVIEALDILRVMLSDFLAKNAALAQRAQSLAIAN